MRGSEGFETVNMPLFPGMNVNTNVLFVKAVNFRVMRSERGKKSAKLRNVFANWGIFAKRETDVVAVILCAFLCRERKERNALFPSLVFGLSASIYFSILPLSPRFCGTNETGERNIHLSPPQKKSEKRAFLLMDRNSGK